MRDNVPLLQGRLERWRSRLEEVSVLVSPSMKVIVAVAAVLLVLGACAAPSPQEKVASQRSRYEASMNGFVVEQIPLETVEEMPLEMAEGEDDPIGEETAEVEAGEGAEVMAEAVALRQNVLVDIVIRHESATKLAGITVDVTMADGERELEVWRVWFDTSGIEKGPGAQFSHTLDDVDYQSGYGFSAEIRHPVPAELMAEYREFSDLGD